MADNSYTKFPNGLQSMGVPFPGSGVGPSQGVIQFIKPYDGVDSNSGESPETARKTLASAQSYATADKNDTVYMLSQSNTASQTTDYQTSTLSWAKDSVHLIGINAGGMIAQRSRIAANAISIDPLINFSGDNCFVANIHAFHGYTADQLGLVSVTVSGQRNHFYNCHFAGGGVSTTADDTGMRSLKVTGSENLFENCYIGLDTIARGVANAEIELSGGATRTIFKNCFISTFSSAGTNFFVTLPDSGGIDRFVLFDNCTFYNPVSSTATAMTDAFNVHASPGGMVILKNCTKVGATGWANNLTNVYAGGFSSNSTYNQGIGFAVNPAA